MVIDCHVHLSATVLPHGQMSQKLLGSIPFKFMRWRLGLDPAGEAFDSELVTLIDRLIGLAHHANSGQNPTGSSATSTSSAGLDLTTHLEIARERSCA
jgi:hypothetical protein